jgi:hypothetical protein
METIDDLAGWPGTSRDDPSGALRAREAHDAGAVVPPAELPTVTVHLEFRVLAPAGRLQAITDELAELLLELDGVEQPATFTVTPHGVPA